MGSQDETKSERGEGIAKLGEETEEEVTGMKNPKIVKLGEITSDRIGKFCGHDDVLVGKTNGPSIEGLISLISCLFVLRNTHIYVFIYIFYLINVISLEPKRLINLSNSLNHYY